MILIRPYMSDIMLSNTSINRTKHNINTGGIAQKNENNSHGRQRTYYNYLFTHYSLPLYIFVNKL